MVRLAFGAAKFDWPATVLTGRTLAFFGLGLAAEGVIHLFVRGYYALHDSKTPMILGAVTVILNIFLSLTFINTLKLPIWSLALSTSIADIIYVFALIYFLDIKVGHFDRKKIISPFFKIMTASLLTGISLYIPMKLLDQLVFDTTRTVPLILLTGTAAAIGLFVYFFLTWVFQIEELKAFLGLLGQAKKLIFEPEETVSDVVNQVPPAGFSETPQEMQ